MKIKKFLRGLRVSLFGVTGSMVNTKLLGKQISTIKGTIREKADKDDAWFYELVKRSNIFFDLGANIGYTSLIAKLTNPDRFMVVVEPNKQAMEFVARNLIINGLISNVYLEQVLLGDDEIDRVEFFTIGVGAAGSISASHAKTATSLGKSQFLRMTTLDTLINRLNIIPDFVKIDVEGAEIRLLRGSVELAKQKKTSFFIEMHDLEETPMETMGNDLLKWCQEFEYKAWYLTDKSELTSGSKIAHRGRCHLLVQPSNWEFPKYLLDIKEGDSLPASK